MRATSRRDEGGYIMVALLVSMAVAAVWMTVLLPAWRQQALRQKEDDLVFRGEQYARAIALYYTKNQAYPPSVDILVSQKFLRKKWKDPITDKDFLLVPAPSPTGQQQAQPVGSAGRAGRRAGRRRTRGADGHRLHGGAQPESGDVDQDLPAAAGLQPVAVRLLERVRSHGDVRARAEPARPRRSGARPRRRPAWWREHDSRARWTPWRRAGRNWRARPCRASTSARRTWTRPRELNASSDVSNLIHPAFPS